MMCCQNAKGFRSGGVSILVGSGDCTGSQPQCCHQVDGPYEAAAFGCIHGNIAGNQDGDHLHQVVC